MSAINQCFLVDRNCVCGMKYAFKCSYIQIGLSDNGEKKESVLVPPDIKYMGAMLESRMSLCMLSGSYLLSAYKDLHLIPHLEVNCQMAIFRVRSITQPTARGMFK